MDLLEQLETFTPEDFSAAEKLSPTFTKTLISNVKCLSGDSLDRFLEEKSLETITHLIDSFEQVKDELLSCPDEKSISAISKLGNTISMAISNLQRVRETKKLREVKEKEMYLRDGHESKRYDEERKFFLYKKKVEKALKDSAEKKESEKPVIQLTREDLLKILAESHKDKLIEAVSEKV